MKKHYEVLEINKGSNIRKSLLSTAFIFLLSIIMLAASLVNIAQNANAAAQNDSIDIVVSEDDWDDDGDSNEIDDGISIQDDDSETQVKGWKKSNHFFDVATGRIDIENGVDWIFISAKKGIAAGDNKIRCYDANGNWKSTYDTSHDNCWRIDTGNVDGDPEDEIFLLDKDYNDGGSGTSDGIRIYDVDMQGQWTPITSWDTDHKNLKDIAAFDYNGDGIKEVAILDGDYNDGGSGSSDGIRIYDVASHDEIEAWDQNDQNYCALDAGDLDNDGIDELVVLDHDWNDDGGDGGSSDGFRIWNIGYDSHTYRGGRDTDVHGLMDITTGDLNYGDAGDDIIILDIDSGDDDIYVYSPEWNSGTSRYDLPVGNNWDTGRDDLKYIDAGDLGIASQSSQS